MLDNRLEPRLTHGALRTRIKKVRASAHDHDDARFRMEFDWFASALAEHLAVESSTVAGLPESAARDLRDGQERILSTLRSLGADLGVDRDGDDRESLAMQLDTLLELQDDAERRSFGARTDDRRA